MTLPPNIKPPDPRRGIAAGLAIASLAAGLAGFAAFNYGAFVLEGQDTVSELTWQFLDWGLASYILVSSGLLALAGAVAWLAVHFLGRGKLG